MAYLGGEVGSVWGGGGVELLGGGGEASPETPLLDETLLDGIMKNPMEPCTCCCVTNRDNQSLHCKH